MSPAPISRRIHPGSFDLIDHYYPRVPNAQLHSLVRGLFSLGNSRIAHRFGHLHPEVPREAIHAALSTKTQHLRWAGADLVHATDEHGRRRMVIIEVNSSPSGQKSMPLLHEDEEQSGYRRLLEGAFLPLLRKRGLPRGGLAVLWDKNPMETSAYAAVLADLTGEPVHLVAMPASATDPCSRFVDGVLQVREGDTWLPIRAALRYVTERPWSRIPPLTRTLIFNPVVACLAGGRNKLLAAKAYDLYNAQLQPTRLRINIPETIWDVSADEVPLWVERMGGVAVVKDPYSNAGQGVFTITNPAELDEFRATRHRYDQFIVQGLIGNVGWSSQTRRGRLYHVGTVPDRNGNIYVADLRMMVGIGPTGFFPVALYARRARCPLSESPGADSWSMLGTNLSARTADGSWTTEPRRLMLMDSRDFNHLGLGLDDLIEAYLQTVLAVTAIDQMAQKLVTQKGTFRRRLFRSLTPDPALVEDICT